jgi:hypothetical protein
MVRAEVPEQCPLAIDTYSTVFAIDPRADLRDVGMDIGEGRHGKVTHLQGRFMDTSNSGVAKRFAMAM